MDTRNLEMRYLYLSQPSLADQDSPSKDQDSLGRDNPLRLSIHNQTRCHRRPLCSYHEVTSRPG